MNTPPSFPQNIFAPVANELHLDTYLGGTPFRQGLVVLRVVCAYLAIGIAALGSLEAYVYVSNHTAISFFSWLSRGLSAPDPVYASFSLSALQRNTYLVLTPDVCPACQWSMTEGSWLAQRIPLLVIVSGGAYLSNRAMCLGKRHRFEELLSLLLVATTLWSLKLINMPLDIVHVYREMEGPWASVYDISYAEYLAATLFGGCLFWATLQAVRFAARWPSQSQVGSNTAHDSGRRSIFFLLWTIGLLCVGTLMLSASLTSRYAHSFTGVKATSIAKLFVIAILPSFLPIYVIAKNAAVGVARRLRAP